MRNYYIVKNGTNSGPYTLDQLKYHGVAPNTKVWYEGLPEWVEAQMVPELNPLFVVPVIAYTPKHEKPGVDWKLVGGLVVVAIVLLLLGWYCTRGQGGIIDPGPEQIVDPCRTEVAAHARRNWGNLVTVQVSDHDPVFLGGVTNLKLKVSNNLDYPIDQMVVKIDYILANDRLFKSENVFFGNVPAKGNSEEIEAPGSERGNRIEYRIIKIKCSSVCLTWEE